MVFRSLGGVARCRRLADRFGANVPEYHPSVRRSHRRETLAVLFSRLHSFLSWGHLVCCHERDTLRRGKVHRCGHRAHRHPLWFVRCRRVRSVPRLANHFRTGGPHGSLAVRDFATCRADLAASSDWLVLGPATDAHPRLGESGPFFLEKAEARSRWGMSLDRREFCSSLGLLSLAATTGCEQLSSFLPAGVSDRDRPSGTAPTADEIDFTHHVLNRCAFGPRPEDRALLKSGFDSWLDQQLNPKDIVDPLCDRTIASIERIHQHRGELYSEDPRILLHDLVRARIIRAVYSRRQLLEVMVDLWTDHFNVAWSKGNCRWLKISDDLEVIRPHSLGRFRDLVRATATSPAMLIYLDGHDNKVVHPEDKPNENHARELLELHTLGVDGGYTQRDVLEAARCMSGWTYGHSFMHGGVSRVGFDSGRHDDGAKEVLGVTIPAGGGENDLERLIDIVCEHQSTSRYVARRLARVFIADSPPVEVVEAIAACYRSSGGDIPEMLETVFGLPAFRENAGTLFKRPFRYLVSVLRATDADTNGGVTIQKHLRRMGQPPFEYPTPDGYPLEAEPWFGSLLWRWNFSLDLLAGRIPGATVQGKDLVRRFGSSDQLLAHLIGRRPTSFELEQMNGEDGISIALASPAFQWH